MKKLFSLIIFFFIAISAYYVIKPPTEVITEHPEVLGVPENELDEIISLEFNDSEYKLAWVNIEDADSLLVIPNFSDKLISVKVMDTFDCKTLVSGGFYTKENEPVGYFLSNENEIRKYSKNSLFDGVLSYNQMLTPRITRELPQDKLIWGIQSGPVLIENDSAQQLSIRNDEPNRRIVAATTGSNKLLFIALYNSNSSLLGPKLADLPEILEIWENETGIDLADAINLDGGSASAFFVEGLSLTESSPVGSFFCEVDGD